jgi:aldose 1-epimerase
MTAPPPPLRLAAGAWEAVLLPAQGAAFAALRHGGRDLIVPVPPGADPLGGFHGAFWMIPWANRLDGGRLPFAGVMHHLPINHPQDNTAIHGLARDRPWRVAEAAPERAVLVQDLAEPGLPFRYAARVEVALDTAGGGVTLAVSVANTAEAPFPFGLGWHPFFVRPPRGTRLAFRAATRFAHDARTLPVAPRRTRGIDGGERSWLGLDTHFAGWDGRAATGFPGGPVLRLAARGAWATNLQVFAPRDAAVLCVEPQSHVPDAPNRPACAAYGSLRVLAPGGSLDAELAISVE